MTAPILFFLTLTCTKQNPVAQLPNCPEPSSNEELLFSFPQLCGKSLRASPLLSSPLIIIPTRSLAPLLVIILRPSSVAINSHFSFPPTHPNPTQVVSLT